MLSIILRPDHISRICYTTIIVLAFRKDNKSREEIILTLYSQERSILDPMFNTEVTNQQGGSPYAPPPPPKKFTPHVKFAKTRKTKMFDP